jgi:short subunit dehydrogenase-like uncharacterized protein
LTAGRRAQGVHYSDLAGEGFWQREMIEKFHTTVRARPGRLSGLSTSHRRSGYYGIFV